MQELKNKKTIIWDLDNTLYRQSPELHDHLDSAMAKALIEDLGVKLGFDEVKNMVKESYKKYRDGGQVFYKEYNIDEVELYKAYHQYVPIGMIEPYDGLLEKLKETNQEHFVFTVSPFSLAKNILKKLGLYEFFRGRIYSIEDFDFLKKNEAPNVYYFLCQKIGADPKECIFVEDSYSNLKYPKQIGFTTIWLSYKEGVEKDHFVDYVFNGPAAFLEELEKAS